ncbi:DUF7346 family protein [Natronorubrum thiooxidans]|uniref:Uncharacterized protein n=1 Tax=Natronorubrum thiooxidans TaxID=308853 RepID=A0A1N7EEI9_9EURY|nr:hypothetical protein [Natronorubrum thiooxidans]SIR86511.1 hypothetical protein SAMN05421752_10416 [Natronorubrum thiooxidans]
MKTVHDDTGKRYLLLKRSEHASLVRNPKNGNECYIQNDRLEDDTDESPLETAARTISDPVRTLLTNVHDEATLGLLIELDNRGPLGIRTLLDEYDFCESDLHGRLTVLSAAGLLEQVDIACERGYRATKTCTTALDQLPTASEHDLGAVAESSDGTADSSS